MSTLQDLQRLAFDASGYTSTDLPAAWMEWAIDNGATATDLQEAIRQVLQKDGDTSINLQDLWLNRLTDLGYTGTLPDMMYSFWEDGGVPFIFGASFDGTNDYLTRGSDLLFNNNGKKGIIATQIRFNGGDGVQQRIYSNSGSVVYFEKAAGNKLVVAAKNAGGTNILNLQGNQTIIADGSYYNILISWDMAGNAYFYIDDIDVANSLLHTDDTIDYTAVNHAICSTTAGTLKANLDVNFLYANFFHTIDFSIESNRRKFFDSNGNPALDPLGDGSIAGLAIDPIIYLAGDYSKFELNKGLGGGFTVTGALSRPTS